MAKRAACFCETHSSQATSVRRFAGVKVRVPPAVVVSTISSIVSCGKQPAGFPRSTAMTTRRFKRRLSSWPLPAQLREDLLAYLMEVKYPVAVRSSSLLEDSHYQPFTGVYETSCWGSAGRCKGPAGAADRGDQRIYASTFSQHAKGYVRAHSLSSRGREDGRDSPASGGGRFTASGFIRILREWYGREFFIRCRRWLRRMGLRRWLWEWAGQSSKREVPGVLSAVSAELDSVFGGEGYSGELAIEFWAVGVESFSHDDPLADLRERALAWTRRERWNLQAVRRLTAAITMPCMTGLSRAGLGS